MELTELRTGIPSSDGGGSASIATQPPGSPGRTRASFRVREGDKPTSAWRPVLMSLADATGNQFLLHSLQHDGSGSRSYVEVGADVFPQETSWKVRVGIARVTNFPAAERHQLLGVALPSPGTMGGPVGVREQKGRVSLARLAGIITGARAGVEPAAQPQLVHVRFDQVDMRLLLIDARDRSGRRLPFRAEPSVRSRDHTYSFDIGPRPKGGVVDLTFAASPIRWVEFTVSPSGTAAGP